MSYSKSLTLATLGLTTIAASNAPVFADAFANDAKDILPTASSEMSVFDLAQDQPANRDFHSVLNAFEADDEDGFKFSGCGSAI